MYVTIRHIAFLDHKQMLFSLHLYFMQVALEAWEFFALCAIGTRTILDIKKKVVLLTPKDQIMSPVYSAILNSYILLNMSF